MAFKNLFSSRKAQETVVVGGEAVQAQSSSLPKSRSFLWISGFLLLGAISLSVFFTGRVLADQTGQWQVYYQLLEEKKTEQQNLEALELLTSLCETGLQEINSGVSTNECSRISSDACSSKLTICS